MSAARLNKSGNVKERPSPNCFRNVRVRPLNMGAIPLSLFTHQAEPRRKPSSTRSASIIVPVNSTRESAPDSRRRAVRDILLYGLCGGVLIVVLKLTEYRFLVVEHSVELYVGLVAALFAGLGIWLGLTLTRKKPATANAAIPAQAEAQTKDRPDPFVADDTRQRQLGISA